MSSDSGKPTKPPTPTVEELIITLEDAMWKAMEKNGKDLLPFLSDDCIMLFPLGLKVSMTSTPSLEDTLTSKAYVPWTGHKMSDIEVTLIGDSGAICSYRVDATRPPLDDSESDEDIVFTAWISSTWKRDEDSNRLVMCFHQQTPFEP